MDVFESKLSEIINKKRGQVSITSTSESASESAGERAGITISEIVSDSSTGLQGDKEIIHKDISKGKTKTIKRT